VSRSNRTLFLVAAAAILAAIFATYEWREAGLARAAERELQARRSELDSRLHAADQDLRQAQARRAVLERPAAPVPTQAPARPDAARPARSYQSRMLWFATHPEMRVRYLKDFRAILDQSYGPVFKALRLPADQIEKVEDLLTQREDKNLTVIQTANAEGVDTNAAAPAAMNDQLSRANNAAIRAVVGKDNYQAIHQYLRQTSVVPMVSDLSNAMAGLSQPLTADQEVKLTTVLAESSQRREGTGAAIGGTVNWDKAAAGAQDILSPDQLSTFALVQQRDQGRRQIMEVQATLTVPAK
jgi:hypothetical protein